AYGSDGRLVQASRDSRSGGHRRPLREYEAVRDVPFTRSLASRLLRRKSSMREDWDLRAREDARFYICTEAPSEDGFANSGEIDLDGKILDGLRLAPQWRVLEIGCGMGRLLRPLS